MTESGLESRALKPGLDDAVCSWNPISGAFLTLLPCIHYSNTAPREIEKDIGWNGGQWRESLRALWFTRTIRPKFNFHRIGIKLTKCSISGDNEIPSWKEPYLFKNITVKKDRTTTLFQSTRDIFVNACKNTEWIVVWNEKVRTHRIETVKQ